MFSLKHQFLIYLSCEVSVWSLIVCSVAITKYRVMLLTVLAVQSHSPLITFNCNFLSHPQLNVNKHKNINYYLLLIFTNLFNWEKFRKL